MDKKKLAVCALFENAAAHLPEWLAYHNVVGVDHFVLYDNGSTDDPARLIRNSPLADHVTLIRWPQRPGQLAAYRHFIDIFAPGFEWAAFLGVDEFLLPLAGRSVLPTLDRLNVAAAVLVQRRVFQPVPQREASPGLLIETHARRAADDFPANRHVRVIARCSELLDVTPTLHEFRVNGLVFNTAGQLTPNAAIQGLPCYQDLVVNHYCTGSAAAWLQRIREDSAAASGAPAAPEDDLADLAKVPDVAIVTFAPAVRQLLRLGSVQGVRPASPAATPAAPRPDPAMPPRAAPAPAAAVAAAAVRPPDLAAAPAPAGAALPARGETPSGWQPRGADAQERVGGLVFRDRSRSGEHWLAALRGSAAATVDPAFLLDEFERIRDFPTAAEARAACDAALAALPAGG